MNEKIVVPLPDGLETEKPGPLESVFYGEDTRVVVPADRDDLKKLIAHAVEHKLRLVPSGSGTCPYLGNPPTGEVIVVSLRRFNRIVRYEPEDFTVGVEAGTPLVSLRDALRENNQEIPIDVAGDRPGTIGGLVASQQPGVRHGRFGPVRSWIIGVHGLDGASRSYKGGGMVVKNVAGYEVARFLPGSLGAAGFLLEINFKLRPLSSTRRARLAGFTKRSDALAFSKAIRALRLDPSSLLVLSPRVAQKLQETVRGDSSTLGGTVLWFFEDDGANVEWKEGRVDSVLSDHGPAYVSEPLEGSALDRCLALLGELDRPEAGALDGTGIARLAVLPSVVCELMAEVQDRLEQEDGLTIVTDVVSGLVTVRWHRDGEEVASPLTELGKLVSRHNGRGHVVCLPPSARRAHAEAFGTDPNAPLLRKLLKVFDPAGIFCSERL